MKHDLELTIRRITPKFGVDYDSAREITKNIESLKNEIININKEIRLKKIDSIYDKP
jgi:hypothetical protein